MARSFMMAMRKKAGSMPCTVRGPPVSAPPGEEGARLDAVPHRRMLAGVERRERHALDLDERGAGAGHARAMALSMFARSSISGSQAAFSMAVWPSAVTAAMSMFSVAPTEGNSRYTWVPRRPFGVVAARTP